MWTISENRRSKSGQSGRVRKSFTAAALLALIITGGAAARIHRVAPGDTLERLGRRYGVSVTALSESNRIANPDHILIGSRLVVPDQAPGGGPPEVAVATRPIASVRPAPTPNPTPKATRPVPVPPSRASLRSLFVQFSKMAGVPADLAMALAWQESGWQGGIVSSTEAVGIMQLMPDTVEFVSRILLRQPRNLDPGEPAANIRMGTRFLRYLLDRSDGKVDAALAAYYQGLRSVAERGVFPETERFVANVKALRERF